jgi:hypothetical protein
MRPMEGPNLSEQHYHDPAALALTDLSPKLKEQRLDITPGDRGSDRMRKDGFQSLRCVRLIGRMVLL